MIITCRVSEFKNAGSMKNSIHSYRWQPPANSNCREYGIYLLHGAGEHAGRYEQLATRLAAAGWHVGAHDHPGHGQSSGKRGLIDPSDLLVAEAARQIQSFADETNSMPVLFGHSLGGAVATELVLQHGLSVKGLILSAPAYAPITTKAHRLKLKLLTVLAPRLCLDLGYNAGRVTHDVEIQQKAQADPLMHSFKSASLINWIIRSGQRSLELASTLTSPTLLLIAGGDLVVDSNKTRQFASQVSSEILNKREYEGFYHELLNETPERRERVLDDIEHWLSNLDTQNRP